ncbi:hypothetical protein DFA_11871 [Cavenderia fasciculata]|uniref:Sugar phosphate transporter domain-containing protein n=1 Tax=Cavenderia fasciculata TaxID=261658 RepID=F4QEJ6_CACFS|nr:uncharacterized protein DFA_11871 [Cavenderia fasciculata]EGG14107.1 hypothetical protein DFA_11871 [Cavenderia fasciculata]|eukprot:XP_004350815.1 hypothetical protein DFA_11871 [Cavenderia fasciculata]
MSSISSGSNLEDSLILQNDITDQDDDKTTTSQPVTTSSSTTTTIEQDEGNTINNQLLQFYEVLTLIYYGIRDSFKVMLAFKILLRSKSLQSHYKHCIMLNGIIFLGSYLVYQYWVDPTLAYLLQQIPALSDIVSIIYCLLWIYPVYIFSIAANSKWYSQIASESFRISGFRNTNGPASVNRILSGIVDEIYRNLMFGVFLVMSVIIAFIPYTSPINFVLVTWLYSFWCFDNKWILRGKWTLMQRITYFELHWAYMFGYGFVFTLASFFFPMLIGNAIFSLLYPMFIILSVGAKPIKMTRKGILPKQIPIFYVSEKIIDIKLNNNNFKQQVNTILPLAILFSGNIVLGNVSLRFVPVSFMQTIKSSVPLFTVIIQTMYFKKNFSKDTYLSMIPIVGGVALASINEANYNHAGFFSALIASVVTALFAIMSSVMMQQQLNPINLLYYMAPYSFIILTPAAIGLELGPIMASWPVDSYQGLKLVSILAFSGTIAFMLNVFTFLVIKYTSALTYTVSGNLKVILSISISILIFRNEVGISNAVGCSIAICGVVWYSYIRYKVSNNNVLPKTLPNAVIQSATFTNNPLKCPKKDDLEPLLNTNNNNSNNNNSIINSLSNIDISPPMHSSISINSSNSNNNSSTLVSSQA